MWKCLALLAFFFPRQEAGVCFRFVLDIVWFCYFSPQERRRLLKRLINEMSLKTTPWFESLLHQPDVTARTCTVYVWFGWGRNTSISNGAFIYCHYQVLHATSLLCNLKSPTWCIVECVMHLMLRGVLKRLNLRKSLIRAWTRAQKDVCSLECSLQQWQAEEGNRLCGVLVLSINVDELWNPSLYSSWCWRTGLCPRLARYPDAWKTKTARPSP